MNKIKKMEITFMVLTFIILWCSNETCCFNLETRIPIIKKGMVDTYFGFSVAEHLENISISANDNQYTGW